MAYVYAHPPIDDGLEERRFCLSEGVLEYRGRQVLYHYSEATSVTFCTATGSPYAGNIHVRGYVLRWKYRSDENGQAISQIEPVTDENEKQEIRSLLWPSRDGHSRVLFQSEHESLFKPQGV
jgi:hypothetical protein